MSKGGFWIVVTGGYSEFIKSDNTAQLIKGSNILVITELGMTINAHIIISSI